MNAATRRAARHAASRARLVWLAAGLLVVSYAIAFNVGQRVEGLLFPVLEGTTIRSIERDDGIVTFRISYTKTRECWPDGFQVLLEPEGGGPFAVVPLEFPDRRVDAPTVRPIGFQVSGRLRFLIPGDLRAAHFRLMFIHDCGMRWRTQTIQGPFDIPPL